MKIKRLTAKDVHGYLPIEIEFFEDLTFLIGLNGCGKTSALRILMAMLTPKIEEFAYITFSAATVEVDDNGSSLFIKAVRESEGIRLSISTLKDGFDISNEDLRLLVESERHKEAVLPVIDRLSSHKVYQAIKDVSTPMFLGLDRKLFVPTLFSSDELDERRRKEFLLRRYLSEDSPIRVPERAALADVNYLVAMKMREIRAAQENLDEELRKKILRSAFEYNPIRINSNTKIPSRIDLDKYRALLAKIGRAAEGLAIPVPDLEKMISAFLERMMKVVDSIESRPSSKKSNQDLKKIDNYLADWVINKSEVDRIQKYIEYLSEYMSERDIIHDPISRFISVVNDFFNQTGKSIKVQKNENLVVLIDGDDENPRSIGALSSGERQILVMLVHLSLNPNLSGSGVFIVDEPELSLHIGWQEKFVDSVVRANPKVQLILATHSPAIILDREESCRSMS